jgi:hypothetical protein
LPYAPYAHAHAQGGSPYASPAALYEGAGGDYLSARAVRVKQEERDGEDALELGLEGFYAALEGAVSSGAQHHQAHHGHGHHGLESYASSSSLSSASSASSSTSDSPDTARHGPRYTYQCSQYISGDESEQLDGQATCSRRCRCGPHHPPSPAVQRCELWRLIHYITLTRTHAAQPRRAPLAAARLEEPGHRVQQVAPLALRRTYPDVFQSGGEDDEGNEDYFGAGEPAGVGRAKRA